ncbi:MAG TPA: hypothetical protein VIO16_02580 [Dehalococcoidia bacterium]|jgi:exo-beta-1,3-glucanase (GH17 family)
MSEQGAQHAEARAHNQPRIYSVDEVSEVFLDEWILMRVTGREHGVPARGEIIEHAKRRKDIQPRVLEAIDSMKQTGHAFYVFRAFKRLRPGEKCHSIVDELLEQAVRGEQRRE